MWLLRLSTGQLRSIMSTMIRPTNKNIWSQQNRMPNNPHCYTTHRFTVVILGAPLPLPFLTKSGGTLRQMGWERLALFVEMFPCLSWKKVWTNSASPAHQKEVLDVCPHITLWKNIDSWGFLRFVQPNSPASYDLPTCPCTNIVLGNLQFFTPCLIDILETTSGGIRSTASDLHRHGPFADAFVCKAFYTVTIVHTRKLAPFIAEKQLPSSLLQRKGKWNGWTKLHHSLNGCFRK